MAIFLFTLLAAAPLHRLMTFAESSVLADGGRLDLQGYPWEKRSGARLNGEWELYWLPDLGSSDFPGPARTRAESPEFAKLPDHWKKGAALPDMQTGEAFATYRLTVALDASSRRFAVQMPAIHTAYQLWLNGELLAEAGRGRGEEADSLPDQGARTLLFTPADGKAELVLQLYGQPVKGGGWSAPYLGLAEKIDAEAKASLSIDMAAVGGLLVLGVHYIVQFLLRRKEMESFWFGCFCLLLGIRALFLSDGVSYVWQAGLSHLTVTRISYISLFLSAPAIGLFVERLYPAEVPRRLVRLMIGLGAISTLCAFLLPSSWISGTVRFYEGASVLLGAWLLVCLGLAYKRGREGAIFVILGAAACLGAMLGDELIGQEPAFVGQLSLFGLLLGTLLASFILSARSVKAMTSVETLSRQMRELNAGLEQKIRDRTAELERINRSLELVNEELARLETSRRHLLSNISHDLGTPMTLIQGYVEALMDGVVKPEQQQQYLKLIHNRILGLSRLIKDLFQLSKLEARQMEFDIQTIGTDELVRFFDERYELELAGAGLRFETTSRILHPGDGRPPIVRVDIDRIDQVLTNIIYNAVKYTPEGGLIQLQFTADEHSLVVQVQDNGAGIAPEDLPYIFDRFYKKDKSRNTAGGGSGLGLAIAKEIIDFHGGRIWAHSRLGQGACIAFMLPLVK
ncbi:His Kinase A (phospho-acceptor) domain-containing protein [Paenibacillus sp. UNCCL117]|uniref:sensor histidine kinase n=1 Tax=unclassified Paenibacillus TaxID=185978 RepID=UPI000888F013|nr:MULTISPECIES: ATP-binding protein [unclassified Paenibacillus]SDD15909.1 His Kinase A (phospho-acceptor) domain-containing protein [Paenibacillus sp. cl123]SFW34564.1 His Kinase A (phospho-acceptor) domain-containing protein [Paenibacillus sp. UNCCL117]